MQICAGEGGRRAETTAKTFPFFYRQENLCRYDNAVLNSHPAKLISLVQASREIFHVYTPGICLNLTQHISYL